jgi:hypothetical protein
MKTLCFDIDGTICTQTPGNYNLAKPYEEALNTINQLYEEGFKIIFFTSRFMGRNCGDTIKAYNEGYEFTKKQLDDWGFKYHELYLGKPMHDIYIDDKCLFYQNDWDVIYKKIKERLDEDIH